MRDLTKEEKTAVNKLESLAKVWPDSLWLFSASGSLCVMGKDENNEQARIPFSNSFEIGGGVDPDYHITTIDIENDGGDW